MEQEIKQENLENKEVKNKKKHGFFYYFLNILFYTITFSVIGLTVLNTIDKNTGYSFLPNHTAVIISNSMSRVNEANLSYLDEDIDHIKKNDVIFTTNYKSFDDIELMDVAVYIGQDGTLICHRVIDKYEDVDGQFVVTRGDANSSDDSPVKYSAVRGKVISVIPNVGIAVGFFQSLYFVMALCFSMFFVFLGTYIYNVQTEKKEKTETGEVEEAPVRLIKPIEEDEEQSEIEEPVNEEETVQENTEESPQESEEETSSENNEQAEENVPEVQEENAEN